MGLLSRRNIGIGLVIAAAGGYVPGVPGVIGGAPVEEAAEALPPAPDVVDASPTEPVGPDDGYIRLIVTPLGVPDGLDEPDEPSDDAAAENADEAPADAADDGSGDDGSADDGSGDDEDGGDGDGAGSSRADRPAGHDAASAEDHVIDPEILSELTGGAILRLDRRERPWAVWPDGTRVPLWGDGGGADMLERIRAAGEADAAAADDADTEMPESGDAEAEDAADDSPTDPDVVDVSDLPPSESVGHPTMDLVVRLEGVIDVSPIGDGTYAVTLEDVHVLDGLPLLVEEDAPMAIGGEPYEGYQWALDNTGTNLDAVSVNPRPVQVPDADIDGVEARPAATGLGVVVAVVDSGVDFSHPDLAPARWTNPGETCGNRVDDDGNGFVDDCNGWDFAYDDDTPWNPGAHAHGTHVAGIIASAIDGAGVAGIAPDAEIMDLNVGTITASGSPGITTSAVARAIRYAVDNGADIVNLSLGTPPGSPRAGSAAIESAIAYADENDVVVVAAAGNNATNLDGAPAWPASYEMANMITVGASDPSDGRASFSNWGSVVDIFAPGHLILSTVPAREGRFLFMSGTSQATPVVAATAALVLDRMPGLTPAEVRAVLVDGADRNDALAQFVRDGVRLNANNALGQGAPSYDIAELRVDVGGLAGATSEAPVSAELDIAMPDDWFAEDHTWVASLLTTTASGVYAVVEHEIAVDEVAVATDGRGSVDLGFGGSGRVSLATTLPEGTYAIVLEAVPVDDPSSRLGDPQVVAFSVGSQGSDPADGGDAGADTGDGGSDDGAGSGGGGRGGGSGGASAGGGGGTAADDGGDAGSDAPGDDAPSDTPGDTPEDDAPGDTDEGGGGGSPSDSEGGPSGDPDPSDGGSGQGAGGSGQEGESDPGTGGAGGGSGSSGGDAGSGSGGSNGDDGDAGDTDAWEDSGPIRSGEWVVDSVAPSSGVTGTRSTIVITGWFPSEVYVWFGDAPGDILFQSSTTIVVDTPPVSDAGTVDVTLRRSGEGVVLTVPGGFTFVGSGSGDGDSGGGGSVGGGGSTGGGGATGGGSAGGGSAGGGSAGGGGSTGGGGATGGGSTGGGESPDDGDGPADGGGSADDGDGSAGDGGSSDGDDPSGGDPTVDPRGRQARGEIAVDVVDLGNGLRGASVLSADPTVGVALCTTDPCRMG